MHYFYKKDLYKGLRKKIIIMDDTVSIKQFPLWQQRFGWACVVMWSEMWGELPIEVNEKIVNLLVETRYKCMTCEKFEKSWLNNRTPYCSIRCWENRRGYTLFGHSHMFMQGPEPPRNIIHYTSYLTPVITVPKWYEDEMQHVLAIIAQEEENN